MFKKLLATALFLLIASPCFGATVTSSDLGTARSGGSPGLRCYKWSWTTGGAETAASDSTQVFSVTGKIVGVLAVEGTVGTEYTIKLLDGAGRDVLQGIFTDTEASAAADDDALYRVPVDDTSSGYIYLWNEPIYLDISGAGNSNSGDVYLYIQVQ